MTGMIAYYKQFNDAMVAYISYGDDGGRIFFTLIQTDNYNTPHRVAVKHEDIITRRIGNKNVKYFNKYTDDDIDGWFGSMDDINETGMDLMEMMHKCKKPTCKNNIHVDDEIAKHQHYYCEKCYGKKHKFAM